MPQRDSERKTTDTVMPSLIDSTSYYPTEHELLSPLDQDMVVHDFHFFAFDRKNATVLASEEKLPHRHEYHEIIWIRSGSAKHLLDESWLEIRPGTLVLVPRGKVHWFRPSAMVEGCSIRFRDTCLPATSSVLFNQFSASSHCLVPGDETPVIEAIFTAIGEEYRCYSQNCTDVITFALRALIAKLEALRWRAEGSWYLTFTGRHRFLEEFNALVERHFRSRHAIGFYAQKLGVSPRKMNEIIRLAMGKTASEIIEERRVLEAKRLSLFSDLSIKEIAFELGYGEHSYFTRVFRKIAGCTPSKFRQQGVSG